MSEYLQKRWVCDYCGRDVKRGVMPPAGWIEIVSDAYANTTHCCPDPQCVGKMKLFCDQHEIEL